MKKNTIRKLFCITFSFLASLVLFVSVLVATVRFSVLERDFLINNLDKSGYVDLLHQKLIEELSNEGYISGFDEEFFSEIFTTDTVKIPVYSAVDKIYGEGEYKSASKEDLSQTLAQAFVNDLKNREIEVDEMQMEYIESFADECAEFFSLNAKLPFISVGETLVKNAKPLVEYVLLFLGVTFIVFALLPFFANPQKIEALRYLSYSFGGASLMTAVPSIVIFATGIIKKISIDDKALYYLVQNVCNELLYILVIVSVALLVVSVLSAVVFSVLRKKEE